MSLSKLSNLTSPHDDLAAVRERLLAVRESLKKACKELDAQIRQLDAVAHEPPPESTIPNLFETEPVPPLQSAPPVPKNVPQEIKTSIVLKATSPATLDPELEQATLEELNSALSKAFAQISGRHPWAG